MQDRDRGYCYALIGTCTCVFFIEPHLQQIGVILRGTGGMGPQFLKSGQTFVGCVSSAVEM